jgi:WD40 repeat protein
LIELDLATGAAAGEVACKLSCWWQSLTTSPDGRFLAGVTTHSKVVLLHRSCAEQSWQEQAVVELPSGKLPGTAAFSPHSDLLAIGDSHQGRLAVWDLAQGKFALDLDEPDRRILGGEFLDADTFLSWGDDGTVSIWDLRLRSVVKQIAYPALRHYNS